MNRSMWNVRSCALLLAAAAFLNEPWSVLGQTDSAAESKAIAAASELVRATGAPGGICTVVGTPDAELALALAKQGSFAVHCLTTDPKRRDSLRTAIRARGVYGVVSADTIRGGRLPYTENLLNLLVMDSYPTGASDPIEPEEVLRVLAPLGCAYLGRSSGSGDSAAWIESLTARLGSMGIEEPTVVRAGGTWVRIQKPWPAAIDEWTHFLHGPDGNPVARDRVVGPPAHYQWIAGPMWLRSHETDSSVSTLVTSRGRLFAIVDQGPISLTGQHSLPDNWFLVARDAFNGTRLWKVPIRRWGWREWKNSWFNTRPGDVPLNVQKRLVAVGERVYVTLGYQAPVSELDARTGEILRTYAGTEGTREILFIDGTLILSIPDEKQGKVMAVDASTGKTIWVSEEAYRGSTVDYVRWKAMHGTTDPPELDPSLNTATDGNVVALIDGPDIVCLDARSGREKWRSSFEPTAADRRAGGIASRGNLWIGTMIVSGGVVVHASPSQLVAFDADSGELLWNQPKTYIGHLWYEWKDVFVIDDLVWTWSAEVDEGFFDIGRARKQRELWPRTVNGYDLGSGELKKSVPLGVLFKTHHHHRCYRNKATLRYILASRRGTEFVDLDAGKHTLHNWVRGTCHVGMMPANGLQYAPPHPCQCYLDEKLNGMNAIAPARETGSPVREPETAAPLELGPAYREIAQPQPPIPSGSWPTFRHDSMRTGSTDTRVPGALVPQWRVDVAGKVSPPIVVGDRLFVALVDEYHVACLDTADGRTLWEFAAGSRVNSPPTYHNGTLLFGSADGWVYCLRAADGRLAWRFRAAPEERNIGAFGRLESAWPVDGSVLVEGGVVYFAAGRTSQLDGGIFLFGLDATTGKLLHQTTLKGPDYAMGPDGNLVVRPGASGLLPGEEGPFDNNFKLPMGALPDILMCDGSTLTMRYRAFDTELNPKPNPKPDRPALDTKSGFLDDNYFKRMAWTFGNDRDHARLIVHDDTAAYFVRMFDTLRGLDPTVYFTPADKGYLLFAKSVGGGADLWSKRVPVRIRAMVLCPERLFVAGPPDVVDPKDPHGAFEGRKGGLLWVVDSASGETLSEQTLPSPPVFNGTAAASGRLYLTAEDGSLTCFGP